MTLIRFLFAPFVETWRGLSLVRLIAAGLAGATMFVMIVSKHISAGAVSMALIALSAAFGKKVFLMVADWLSHRISLEQQDKTVTVFQKNEWKNGDPDEGKA